MMATGNGNNPTHRFKESGMRTAIRAASSPEKVRTPRFFGKNAKLHLVLPLLLILVTAGVYANGMDGEFVFDDAPYVVDNPNIRSLGGVFKRNVNQEARPTVYATLALNYALFELNPKGYHLFNLLIHMLAMLTLYGVVRTTLCLPSLRARFESVSSWLAVCVALLWSIHPLQSECVVYVFQRSESMQALFYLLAIYSYLHSVLARGRRRGVWIVACLVAAVIGMGCKASFVTLPAVLLLYDRVFLSKTLTETVRQRGHLIVGVVVAVVSVGVATADIHRMVLGYGETTSPEAVDFSVGYATTPMEYIRSQPTVILKYLQFVFWPIRLCLDYRMLPVDNAAQIYVTSSALLLLLGLAGILLRRCPPLGFCLLFMFVVLAPTTLYWKMELMFTYRMYLPLAGVIGAVVFPCYVLLDERVRVSRMSRHTAVSIGVSGLILVTVLLGAKTVMRNRDFQNPTTLYESVVENCPENPRGHFNLANRLVARSRKFRTAGSELAADAALTEAIEHYKIAIRHFPRYIDAHVNLAIAYGYSGRTDALIEQLADAVSWYPDHPKAQFNLALAYRNRGFASRRSGRVRTAMADFKAAVTHYRESLVWRPNHHDAIWGLGLSLYFLGRYNEVVSTLESFIETHSQSPDMVRLLGNALYKAGRYSEAEKVLRRYLQSDPTSQWAQKNLKKAVNAQRR